MHSQTIHGHYQPSSIACPFPGGIGWATRWHTCYAKGSGFGQVLDRLWSALRNPALTTASNLVFGLVRVTISPPWEWWGSRTAPEASRWVSTSWSTCWARV